MLQKSKQFISSIELLNVIRDLYVYDGGRFRGPHLYCGVEAASGMLHLWTTSQHTVIILERTVGSKQVKTVGNRCARGFPLAVRFRSCHLHEKIV
mgnify:CR=1 FL=1